MDTELFIKSLPICISVISLIIAIVSYASNKSKLVYFNIDKQYYQLLKTAMDIPDLRNFSKTSQYFKEKGSDFYTQYIIYAYMVWNCLETIYDHKSINKTLNKRDKNTWLPVLQEENKFHYAWFRHNIEKFKPNFSKFVTEELNNIVIELIKTKDIQSTIEIIYQDMKKQFPIHERKTKEQLIKLLNNEKYKLFLAKHLHFPNEDDNLIGYAFVFEDNENRSIWFDYLAINKQYQNYGYGTLLFKKVVNEIGNGNYNVYIELEIPSPKSIKSLAKKRIVFYERLGALLLDCDYYLPTPSGKAKMNLYCLQNQNESPTLTTIQDSMGKALSDIHDDLPNAKEIIEENKNNIEKNFENIKRKFEQERLI